MLKPLHFSAPLPRWTFAWKVDVRAGTVAHGSGIVYEFRPAAARARHSPPATVLTTRTPWAGRLAVTQEVALSQLQRYGRYTAARAVARLVRIAEEAATLWEFEAWDACLDCSTPTTLVGEYFMVRDVLWQQAVPRHQRSGMLCVGCLETRVGRQLAPADFSAAVVNSPRLGHSKRLLERLSESPTKVTGPTTLAIPHARN